MWPLFLIKHICKSRWKTACGVRMLTLASRLIASTGPLYRSDRGAQLRRSPSSSGCSWRSCSGSGTPAKTSLGPAVLTALSTHEQLSRSPTSPPEVRRRACCWSAATRAACPGPLGGELKPPVAMPSVSTVGSGPILPPRGCFMQLSIQNCINSCVVYLKTVCTQLIYAIVLI